MRRIHRIAAFFVVLILMGAGNIGAAPRPEGGKLTKVLVQKAEEKEDVVKRKYVGRLEAIKTVHLQARVSGNIVNKFFKEGDLVKEGQVLFEIEKIQYQANVKAAEAKLKQLDAELRYARNSFERYERLQEKQVVSKDTMENALSSMQSLQAQILAAEANLTSAQFDLSHTEIIAPMTGRIGRETYSVGSLVTPSSEPLATIVMVDPVYVRFPMSERDFLSLFGNAEALKRDAVVSLKLADNRVYEGKGKVSMSDNLVKSGTDTLNVWAQLDNSEGQLTPGGIVTVNLSKSEKELLPAVLISAVMTDEKGNYLYVLGGGNVPERRDVRVGSIQGNYQLIEEGLKPGEIVVVDGTHKVIPGVAVAPVFNY